MQALPDSLRGREYYKAGKLGEEAALKDRLEYIKKFKTQFIHTDKLT